MADRFILKAIECDIDGILKKHGLGTGERVQKFIDSRVLELCAPLVPKDNNTLIESGELNTQIGSGEVKYRTPYARRWYYMPANFQEGSGSGMETKGRGNYWFERMKEQYRKQILDGAIKEAFK